MTTNNGQKLRIVAVDTQQAAFPLITSLLLQPTTQQPVLPRNRSIPVQPAKQVSPENRPILVQPANQVSLENRSVLVRPAKQLSAGSHQVVEQTSTIASLIIKNDLMIYTAGHPSKESNSNPRDNGTIPITTASDSSFQSSSDKK